MAFLPLAIGSSLPTSGAAAAHLFMSPRGTSPSAAGLLACFGVRLDDGVCHGDIVLNLEIWAHSGGVGDAVAEGTGPTREVPSDSMEVVDICRFAGGLAQEVPFVVGVVNIQEVQVDRGLGDVRALGEVDPLDVEFVNDSVYLVLVYYYVITGLVYGLTFRHDVANCGGHFSSSEGVRDELVDLGHRAWCR